MSLLAASTCAPVVASASGFGAARFGGEHGHPTTNNATAIYYNPAGIADAERFHVFVDGTLAWRSASYERTASSLDSPLPSDDYSAANAGKASLFNVIASPMGGFTGKLGDFAFGAAFFVPMGGSASWDKNETFRDDPAYPGPVDGVQRWWSIEGNLRVMYASLAAAYRIDLGGGRGLSFGLAPSLIMSSLQTLRARDVSGGTSLDNEGRSLVDVSGIQFGLGAGVLAEVLPDRLFIGASYQSRPNFTGGARLTGTLKTSLPGGELTEDAIDLYQDLPDVFRLGARFRPVTSLELRLFGDWSRWGAFVDQCIVRAGSDQSAGPCEAIEADGREEVPEGEKGTVLQYLPRDWNDAFGVRLGASYYASKLVELFGGVGYDGNAVPDRSLDPALTDFDKFSIAAGLRLTPGDTLGIAASYTQVLYVGRDTSGKYGFAEFESPSAGPDAGGTYGQAIGFFNVNVDVAF